MILHLQFSIEVMRFVPLIYLTYVKLFLRRILLKGITIILAELLMFHLLSTRRFS